MKRLLMPCFRTTSHARVLAVALATVAGPACDGDEDPETPFALVAGDLTIFDRSSNAFKTAAPNLDDDELALHVAGDGTFDAVFVTAPAPVNAGLGPTFNATACSGCHPRDGRGLALTGGPPLFSPLLVRVSLPEGEPEAPGGAVPVPRLGTQIQDHAVYGESAEATVRLMWEDVRGAYGDGTPYTLRRPVLDIRYPDGTPIEANIMTSPRVPPPVFGLGLLEAVPEATIAALADPDDADGDGISGRMNHVWDDKEGRAVLGRFGWKANTKDLEHQVAGAYFNDMGITSPLHPAEDGTTEIGKDTVDLTAFYIQTLGVPAPDQRADRGAVARGERLFRQMGCASCHVEDLETGPHAVGALANQRIRPYTDLLLHDMGPGLADHRPDWEASGTEWRTTALWGLGLTETVLPGASYLHDGRAKTVAEAILWHGGEAEKAREAFRNASSGEREALLTFLRSR